MMTVRLRLVGFALGWLLRPGPKAPQTVSRLEMRCWPTDCDINGHMNNSRYLALMDIGRYHYLLVTRLMRAILRRRWAPMLVRAEIDYRKGIRPGQRFVLETSLEKLGTKSVTLQQRFLVQGEVMAQARVVGLFLAKGKTQDLGDLMASRPELVPSSVPGA